MPEVSDEVLLESPAGQQARHMLHYAVTGDARTVRRGLLDFAEHARADELMAVSNLPPAARLDVFEVLAQAMGMSAAG